MSTREMAAGLRDRLAERGVQLMSGRVYMADVGGVQAHVTAPDPDAIATEPAFAAASRALMRAATFAEGANAILRDPRLSGQAKADDVRALAVPAGADVAAVLAEADAEIERAKLAVARVVPAAPVPRAADAVEAVADVEKRGLLRAQAMPDAMRVVAEDRAQCLALLREPAGFPEPLIQHARAAWAKFEPGAAVVDPAERTLAAWRAARDSIASAQAALLKLSGGRSSGTIGPARAA